MHVIRSTLLTILLLCAMETPYASEIGDTDMVAPKHSETPRSLGLDRPAENPPRSVNILADGNISSGSPKRAQLALALWSRLSAYQTTGVPSANLGVDPSDLRLPWVRLSPNIPHQWGLVLPGADPGIAKDPDCPKVPSEWYLFSGIRPRYLATINQNGQLSDNQGLDITCALVFHHHESDSPQFVLKPGETKAEFIIKAINGEIQRILHNKGEAISATERGFAKPLDPPPSPRIMGSDPNRLGFRNAVWPHESQGSQKKNENNIGGDSKYQSGIGDNQNHRKKDADVTVEPKQLPDTRFIVVLVLFIITLVVLITLILAYCVIRLKAKPHESNSPVTPHSYRHYPAEIPPWFSNNSKGYNFSKGVLKFETSPTHSCVSDHISVDDDSTPLSPATNPIHRTHLTATVNAPRIGLHHNQKMQGKSGAQRARPNGAGAVPPVIP